MAHQNKPGLVEASRLQGENCRADTDNDARRPEEMDELAGWVEILVVLAERSIPAGDTLWLAINGLQDAMIRLDDHL